MPAVEPSSRESGSSVPLPLSLPLPSAVDAAAAADDDEEEEEEREEEEELLTGGAASPSLPHIVYVFPEPVCPYARTVTAYPATAASRSLPTPAAAKVAACDAEGGTAAAKGKTFARGVEEADGESEGAEGAEREEDGGGGAVWRMKSFKKREREKFTRAS